MAEPKLRVRASGLGGSGYAIPTRLDANGKPVVVPGVTTVLKVLEKPALNQWYADQVAARAVTSLDYLASVDEADGYKSIRFAGSYMLKHYADIGTNVHEWVESYIREDFDLPELLTDEAVQCVDRFLEWVEQVKPEFLGSELTVYHPELGYAGTLDILARIDGVVYIIDIKTGRGIYDESWMQQYALLNAPVWLREVDSDTAGAVEYKGGWFVEDVLPVKPTDVMVLHIRPEDVTNDGEVVESFLRAHYDTVVSNVYFEAFTACLEMCKLVYKMRKVASVGF